MTVPLRFGVIQLTMESVEHVVEVAEASESAGFDTFWLGEAYPWWRKHGYEARSLTSTAAVIAHRTRRITVGWGIVSPYTRHPIQIAMEARAFQDVAGPDRLLLGLGASRIFMKHAAADGPAPVKVMREAMEIVRGVLGGAEFSYEGEAFTAQVPAQRETAEAARQVPPLYMAGTGPLMQRLAGELADGLITASISTPDFMRWSAGNLRIGAERAGRSTDDIDLGAVIVASIGDDADSGGRGAREIAAMYLANKVQNIGAVADTLLEKAGLSVEEIRPVAEGLESGGLAAATAALSNDVFAKVRPIAGTADQCASRIEEYVEAGCRHILLELWGPDRPGQVARFGTEVLPRFRHLRHI